MNPNLERAIIEFLANEYHLPADTLSPDTNFKIDLGLNPDEISALLQRLEDALSFNIPEEKFPEIETVNDLIIAVSPDKDNAGQDEPFI